MELLVRMSASVSSAYVGARSASWYGKGSGVSPEYPASKAVTIVSLHNRG